MTDVIGQAFIEVLADGRRFPDAVTASTQPGLDAAVGASETAGRKIGDGLTAPQGAISAGFTKIGGSVEQLGEKVGGPLGEALVKTGGLLDKVGESSQNVATKVVGIGAGIAALGGLLTAESAKDERAQRQLATAITDTGHSYDDYKDKIEHAISTQEKYGYTANTTMAALQTLTTRLHDPQKALDDLQIAADVAAAKNISLAAAADLVGKAASGNAKVLKQFGIAVTDGTKATKAAEAAAKAHDTAVSHLQTVQQRYDEILALSNARKADEAAGLVKSKTSAEGTLRAHQQLQGVEEQLKAAQEQVALTAQKQASAQAAVQQSADQAKQGVSQLADAVKGQADAKSNDWIGTLNHLKATITDTLSNVGSTIGGPLLAVGGVISTVGGAFDTSLGQKAVKAVVALTSRIAATRVGTLAASAATTVWTGVQAAFNAVMDANPIAIVILAIAALVAGVIIAYKTSGTFRDVVRDAFGVVKTVISDAMSVARGALSGGETAIHALGTAAHAVGGAIQTAFNATANVVKGVINAAIIDPVDAVINLLNSLQIHIPSVGVGPFHTPGFDWGGLHLPTIPHLAAGGDFSGFALTGEFGPELIAGRGRVFNRTDTARALGGPTLNVHPGGIVVNIAGDSDEAKIRRGVQAALDEFAMTLRGRGVRVGG